MNFLKIYERKALENQRNVPRNSGQMSEQLKFKNPLLNNKYADKIFRYCLKRQIKFYEQITMRDIDQIQVRLPKNSQAFQKGLHLMQTLARVQEEKCQRLKCQKSLTDTSQVSFDPDDDADQNSFEDNRYYDQKKLMLFDFYKFQSNESNCRVYEQAPESSTKGAESNKRQINDLI